MPDASNRNSLRPKQRQNRWVTARKLIQGAALAIFLLTVLFSRQDALSGNAANYLIRLSPLVMLANLFSAKTFLAGSTLSLLLLLSSLVVGRAWCAWLCPLGTILDIFKLTKKKNRKEPPQALRAIKYGLLIVILISAIFGNLSLLFLDPLTLFTRSTALTILPVIDQSLFAIEKILVKIPAFSNAVYSFDAWLRPNVLPLASASLQYALLVGMFFVALLLLNLIAERFWCRYLCPLGAMLGMPARFAFFQRRTNTSCSECGLCGSNCPTGTIDAQKGFRSDPAECTLCMNCKASCRTDAFSYAPKWLPAGKQSYDLNRRSFLAGLGISIVSVALLSVERIKQKAKNFLLRPPGVTDEEDFLSSCIRCGVCLKVCPTQALQPDFTESGLEGLWTPILLPRNGFCDFSCNTCGQNCPVQAIPPLTLEEKQQTTLGHAYIDHNRCIAWSDHNNCIVCEEMCPLPQKAISLEISNYTSPDGSTIELKLPIVDRSLCIGCGTCENKCPVQGDAAIRVYTL